MLVPSFFYMYIIIFYNVLGHFKVKPGFTQGQNLAVLFIRIFLFDFQGNVRGLRMLLFDLRKCLMAEAFTKMPA